MKSFPKVLSLILALMMFAGTACMAEINVSTAMPVTTEPIDVSIAVYPHGAIVFSEFDPEDYAFSSFFDAKSGLNIDWRFYDPQSKAETLSLMMAGDDMPNCIINCCFSPAQVMDYGIDQGLLYPIDELLDYMPTYKAILENNKSLKSSMTAPDGHMYGLPVTCGKLIPTHCNYIRQDWLDNLGLDAPETLDEYYEVLKAFKEQDANGNGDPDDEIPWCGSWSEGLAEDNFILSAYGLVQGHYGSDTTVVDYSDGAENARIAYAPYAAEFKDYLIYMNKLFTEGLLDPDIFTQNETQAIIKLTDDVVGCYMDVSVANYMPADSYYKDNWAGMRALTVNKEDTPVVGNLSTTEIWCVAVISSKCTEEQAAALANLNDYFFTPDYYIDQRYGPELNSEFDPKGIGMYFDEELGYGNYKGNDGSLSGWVYLITHFNPWTTPGYVSGNPEYEQMWAEKYPDSICGKTVAANGGVYSDIDLLWQEKIEPYYVESVPELFMSDDDTERIAILKTQLDNYAKNMEAKFITGEVDIEAEYDNFVKTLESYGVQEFEEIYNVYYDKYNAAK